MGLGPFTVPAIGAGVSILGSLLGGGGLFQGKEVEPKPLLLPGMSESDYERILGKAEGLASQQWMPQINDLMKFAYSIPLQHYMGMSPQNITIPGLAQLGGGHWGQGLPGMGGGTAGMNPWMGRSGGASWMGGLPKKKTKQAR